MNIATINNLKLHFDIDENATKEDIALTIDHINIFLSKNFPLKQPQIVMDNDSEITVIKLQGNLIESL